MKSRSKKEKKQAVKPEVSVEKRSALTEFFKNPFFSSRLFEILLFCFIIGLAFIGRMLFLSADTPHISWSQDVATDPPQYTYFARNNALWGSWNLFGQYGLVFFLKSFTTVASYLVFSIFGTGRFQANLVAVILNLLTMVFLFLTLKKIFNKRTAYLSLFFLGINFVFIMYGRNPFLEISAIFLLTLGFYFLVSSFSMDSANKKNLLLIPSGICFAAGIFFGKTMAAFILPACLGVLLLWMFEHSSSSSRKMNLGPLVFFGSGFILVSVFWLFFSYLPAKKEVAGYLGEQALGLYGFPDAFQSISGFASALFTFGTELFYRMPVVFLLSFLGLFLYFQNSSSLNELIRHKDHRSKVVFFLVFWFLAAFFLLMSLNYRPLRYQLYLIPPMCALSGLWLDSFLRSFGSKRISRLGTLFWVFFVIGGTFFINYVITIYHILRDTDIELILSLVISFVITLLFGALYYWRFTRSGKAAKGGRLKESKLLNPGQRLLIMLVLILISLVVNGGQYVSWASAPTYSLNRYSVDLGKILSQEAVISGPYGPALVWDNKLKNVIHMFTVKADPQLFLTYPITHLALERGENRDRAFQDYPEVMERAKIVTVYWLRNIPVDIYRIGEWTGNPQTEKYSLSDFEKARLLMEEGETESALVLLEEFVSAYPKNFSGNQALAEIYFEMREFDKAALALERAAQFNPTDFSIREQLGTVYLNMGYQTGDETYLQMTIEQWEKALKLFPENTQLAEDLQTLKGY